MVKYKFHIYYPDESTAGLIGYSDKVTVTVDSGDPGGEYGEFEQFMSDCLSEWYEGASVTIEEADNEPPQPDTDELGID